MKPSEPEQPLSERLESYLQRGVVITLVPLFVKQDSAVRSAQQGCIPDDI